MTHLIVVGLVMVTCGHTEAVVPESTNELTPVNETEAEVYLQKFGYWKPEEREESTPRAHASTSSETNRTWPTHSLTDAIKNFQRLSGLESTGVLDLRTRKKMAQPRCGFPDVSDALALTSKWYKRHLTYTIQDYTTDMDNSHIRMVVRNAFQVWADVVPLRFEELTDKEADADIRIGFRTGSHDDGDPFDGPGRTLAHAYLPPTGIIHFDDSEHWTYKDASKLLRGYTDLYWVAIHEVGHVLGLDHIVTPAGAIMAKYYTPPLDDDDEYDMPRLSEADISAIQSVYGSRRDDSDTEEVPADPRPEPTYPTDGPEEDVDECPASVDAIAQGMRKRMYVFDGARVYNFVGTQVAKVHSVEELFPDGPSKVKAALSNGNGRNIWLLDRVKVYEYRWSSLLQRYRLEPESPRSLADSTDMRWIDDGELLLSSNYYVVCTLKAGEELCTRNGDSFRVNNAIQCRQKG